MKFLQIKLIEDTKYNLLVGQDTALDDYFSFVEEVKNAHKKNQMLDYRSENGNFLCNPDHLISVLLMENVDEPKAEDPKE